MRENAVGQIRAQVDPPKGGGSIDITQLPDFYADELVIALLANVTRYFQQPGVERQYKRWLENRNRLLAEKGALIHDT
jgi:hypothetical protein